MLAGIAVRMTPEGCNLACFPGQLHIVLVAPAVEVNGHSLCFNVGLNDLAEAPVVHLVASVDVLVKSERVDGGLARLAEINYARRCELFGQLKLVWS